QINVRASGSKNSDKEWLNSPSHTEDSNISKKIMWDFVNKIAKRNISKKRKHSHSRSKHKAKKSKKRKSGSSSFSSNSSSTLTVWKTCTTRQLQISLNGV
ncbi:unnamed protein product, partial [Owenia fusiformis]